MSDPSTQEPQPDDRNTAGACTNYPPGMENPTELIKLGFTAFKHSNDKYEYARLKYVYPDLLYFRKDDKTYRCVYIAEPVLLNFEKPQPPVSCGFAFGFWASPLVGGEVTQLTIFALHTVSFLEK